MKKDFYKFFSLFKHFSLFFFVKEEFEKFGLTRLSFSFLNIENKFNREIYKYYFFYNNYDYTIDT